jgi:serine phosphatase RsbU (regulator of sigma subunit)/predicted enzyme related to lactoylglutathione lyase
MHAVRVFVRDLERSLRFYRDQLGFRLAFDARLQSGQRWVAVAPPDGTALISLVAPGPSSPEHKLIGRATQVVFVTDDVVAKFREWAKRGVRFRNVPRLRRIRYDRGVPAGSPATKGGEDEPIWGGVFTRFEDVDGNSFSLVSFDEESRAVEAHRRAEAQRRERERRAAHEMEIARQVQARLFPQGGPTSTTLDYAGLCLPARQVGGDYYDFLSLGRGSLGLVLGDVAGKGIAAALLMAHLQASLRSQVSGALDEPAQLLRSVNRLFYENTTAGAYATLFFAAYEDGPRRLRYANCGHLCGLLFRGDGTFERLETTGPVVGLFEEWDCTVGERRLDPGDRLVLYTDGVTESFNEADEEFGERRLIDAVRGAPDSPPRATIAAVVDGVRRFSPREQHDDITLIVARCRAA